LTDTFAGIRPADVFAFIAAQFGGALCGTLIAGAVFLVRPKIAALSSVQKKISARARRMKLAPR